MSTPWLLSVTALVTVSSSPVVAATERGVAAGVVGAAGGGEDGRADMMGTYLMGATGNNSIKAVQLGDSVKLECLVPAEMFGSRVSWVRRRDFQLLAVGETLMTDDHRLFVSHSRHSHAKDARHSQLWFLHMMNVTKSDEGEYECQVATHPHSSFYTFLKVQNAYSEVRGPRVVAAGSGLQLVCAIQGAADPPAYVFWFLDNTMINYATDRGFNATFARDRSILTLVTATEDHGGNYTCQPSNAAPSSVQVHVVSETTESGASKDGKSDGKTPVQLGVKSVSSAGPQSLPPILALTFIGLMLHALTFFRVLHVNL